MKGRIISAAIMLALAAVVAVSVSLLVIQPWEGGGTSAGAGPRVSGGGACLAADLEPAFSPPLSGDDCVTSFGALASGDALVVGAGDVAVGTKDGLFGVIRDGVLKTRRPPGATGAVTDVGGTSRLAWFVVDQGVGLYNPETDEFLRAPASTPGSARLVTAEYYVNPPGPGRPQYTEEQGFVKYTEDGVEQRFGFNIVAGNRLCLIYMRDLGAGPSYICTEDGVMGPPLVVTPAPRLPARPCARSMTPVEDPTHHLTVAMTRETLEPSKITIKAGEPYTITVELPDWDGWIHQLWAEDVTDAEGYPICTLFLPKNPTVTFTIHDVGTYVLHDRYGYTDAKGELVVIPGDRPPPALLSAPAGLD